MQEGMQNNYLNGLTYGRKDNMITTKNIILVYHLANPSEIKHGLTWYINAILIAKRLH